MGRRRDAAQLPQSFHLSDRFYLLDLFGDEVAEALEDAKETDEEEESTSQSQ